MPTTVIANAAIVTGNPARDVIHDGAVAITDDVVSAVGPAESVLASNSGADVIDGRGKAVFPGLINCHAHLLNVLSRGITEDFGFPPDLPFPVSIYSMVDDEERNALAALAAVEAIRSGSTTLMEMAAGIDVYARSIVDTGLRLILAENTDDGVMGPAYRPGQPPSEFSASQRETKLGRAEDLFSNWHGARDGRVTCFASTQLVETSSPELLAEIRAMAERYDTGYTIHLAQSRLEVETLLAQRGKRPSNYLADNDFLGPRLVAAHVRYVDEGEIAALGASKTHITHQPAMASLRAVHPPIPALRDAGCVVGLGTDNNTQDMFEVMRTALRTERVATGDARSPQPEDVVEWATMGSARALHMENEIGSLEVGKKADLFMIDMRRAHLVPTMRIVSSWIHNGQPGDIESVMVDGDWVMRDGRVLTVNEFDLIDEVDRIGRRAWSRMLEENPDTGFPLNLSPGPR
ncbi:MAG: amidohydrolase family protein [Chloroflexi bacterium]|jgi:5-methylthioadenosine/S-adenosylhomocysteine deaminase|nr:amidohydrolase family protein [Chloroflexota bacterium]MBT4072599.1 amidohydrolase family protein [Chloroflexota bacterium]MBT4515727.1 amidohydrolase family protein [Chloroflexota bacterium]MBT6682622.1 amidohydrolase family protein [Chloroflexota bacterium]